MKVRANKLAVKGLNQKSKIRKMKTFRPTKFLISYFLFLIFFQFRAILSINLILPKKAATNMRAFIPGIISETG